MKILLAGTGVQGPVGEQSVEDEASVGARECTSGATLRRLLPVPQTLELTVDVLLFAEALQQGD